MRYVYTITISILLLLITIVFSSNIYAKPKEMDREKYDYACSEMLGCENVKKGDVLIDFRSSSALLYCDTNYPILQSREQRSDRIQNTHREYDCLYNGRPFKEREYLPRK